MPQYQAIFTSQQISCEEYFKQYDNGDITRDEIINILVGDIQRMKVFVDKGWQIPMEIPRDVWEAYEKLVNLGFDKYLIR